MINKEKKRAIILLGVIALGALIYGAVQLQKRHEASLWELPPAQMAENAQNIIKSMALSDLDFTFKLDTGGCGGEPARFLSEAATPQDMQKIADLLNSVQLSREMTKGMRETPPDGGPCGILRVESKLGKIDLLINSEMWLTCEGAGGKTKGSACYTADYETIKAVLALINVEYPHKQ